MWRLLRVIAHWAAICVLALIFLPSAAVSVILEWAGLGALWLAEWSSKTIRDLYRGL